MKGEGHFDTVTHELRTGSGGGVNHMKTGTRAFPADHTTIDKGF